MYNILEIVLKASEFTDRDISKLLNIDWDSDEQLINYILAQYIKSENNQVLFINKLVSYYGRRAKANINTSR